MSTLKADTIQNTSGGAVTLTKQHAAKAWVYFSTKDNPPNADGSFGTSSLTDNTQEVEVNLTNAMSDLFFCPVAGGGGGNNPDTNPSNRNLAVCIQSTTKVDSEGYSTANNPVELQCHIAVLGDLA